MSDPTDKAVALLKAIGLDITYTDEGLRVVADQIGRAYRADERERTIGLLSDLHDLYGDALQALLAFSLLYPQIDESGWGPVDEGVAAIRRERAGA